MDTDDDAGRYHTILAARQPNWGGFAQLHDEADAEEPVEDEDDDAVADADDDRLPQTKLSAMALQGLRAHEATLRDDDGDDVSSTGAADGDLEERDERDSFASDGANDGYYGGAGAGAVAIPGVAPGPGTPEEGSLQADMDAQVPMLFASGVGGGGGVLHGHGGGGGGAGEPMDEDEREGEVAEIKLSEGE